MKASVVVAAIVLTFSPAAATGQTSDPKPAVQEKTKSSKTAATNEVDPQERARRAQARSLLVALSTDARTFGDARLRARSLARIADTLWQVDAEQGRLMFRKAWEAAEVSDRESDLKAQEDIRQQKLRSGGYVMNKPRDVRREVLRLAARHDRVLSEEFLEKLKAQKLEAANSATTPGRNSSLSEDLSQRLSVARELLKTDETERALQFADPALTVVSRETLDFLSDVRDKDAAAADKRYANLLAIAGGDPQSDGNTVSLLSSYIFTPHLFIIFEGGGTSTSQRSDKIVPADVSPDLRLMFFQAAAQILLKPLPAATTSAVPPPTPNTKAVDPNGLEARYLIMKRLMPFFEQSAPADLVESLRGQLNALSSLVSDDARRRDDEWFNKGVKPDKPAAEQEQALLDRVDRAKTSAERDSLYVQLAFMLAHRGDMRARDYVSKIDESELRKGAQAYIDTQLASYAVQKKLTDQALELASKGDLTHLYRVWVLTECAKQLFKTDKEKALELVESAATEARRIEVSDPLLPSALLAVANSLVLIEPSRSWDATFDAVKAANSATGFTGEDGTLVNTFQSKNQRSMSNSDVAEFNVEGVFRELATKDYDRAVELARGFQGEGPRAVATIAIARAILEPKKPAVAVKN